MERPVPRRATLHVISGNLEISRASVWEITWKIEKQTKAFKNRSLALNSALPVLDKCHSPCGLSLL